MGFKDFCTNNNSKEYKAQQTDTKNVEEIYDKYKDKNQDELLNELFNNVNKQKENGTFNYEAICNMVEKMSPFLTKEQNLRIKELLKKLV